VVAARARSRRPTAASGLLRADYRNDEGAARQELTNLYKRPAGLRLS
jgi:hypothetical protein